MSKILKTGKYPLIYQGYDCDIFELSESLVYKHYAPYKLGQTVMGHPNPTTELKKIKCDNIEPVLDYDNEGFVTHKLLYSAGTILLYDFPVFDTELIRNNIGNLSEYLYNNNISHNDILPSNIMYDHTKEKVILIDWTHLNNPNQDTKDDKKSLIRWNEICGQKKPWFEEVNPHLIGWVIEKEVISLCCQTNNFDKEFLYHNLTVDFSPYVMREVMKVLESDEKTITQAELDVIDRVLKYQDAIKEQCKQLKRYTK